MKRYIQLIIAAVAIFCCIPAMAAPGERTGGGGGGEGSGIGGGGVKAYSSRELN